MNVNVVKLSKAASMLIAAAVLGVFFGASLYAALHFGLRWWPQ